MSHHTYFPRAMPNHRFIGCLDYEFKENCFEKLPMEAENRILINKEDEDLANCLVLLKNNAFSRSRTNETYDDKSMKVEVKGKFQCKTCNKIFDSHQALGGHRASHKKVKGCFASTIDNFNNTVDEFSLHGIEIGVSAPRTIKRKRSKAHECSICHRVFASGQALGGHKRCHWISPISNFPVDTGIASLADFRDQIRFDNSKKHCNKPFFQNCEAFDLNLSPMVNDDDDDDDDEAALKFEDENCKQSNMKKLKRLSDLDEGGSISWLQVGISSSSTLGGTSPSS